MADNKDGLYQFRSGKAKDWATWSHPGLVKIVRKQLTRFWDRVAILNMLDKTYREKKRKQNELPDGYVALYMLVKEYDLSYYFVKKAIKSLPSASRIRHLPTGSIVPKRIWIAKEEEARDFFAAAKAEREQILLKMETASEPKPESIPTGAMPVVDIANALGMSHGTLGRWVRDQEIPTAGRFRTRRLHTNNVEVYTWPAVAVAEIIKRNAGSHNRKIRWIGLEELKRTHMNWFFAAQAHEWDKKNG